LWQTAAKGTVAISLPPRVSLKEDHLLTLGQHSSPGKHLHWSSLARTVGVRVAKKATKSEPAFEQSLEKRILTAKDETRCQPPKCEIGSKNVFIHPNSWIQ
jgi:hypothetical protein